MHCSFGRLAAVGTQPPAGCSTILPSTVAGPAPHLWVFCEAHLRVLFETHLRVLLEAHQACSLERLHVREGEGLLPRLLHLHVCK